MYFYFGVLLQEFGHVEKPLRQYVFKSGDSHSTPMFGITIFKNNNNKKQTWQTCFTLKSQIVFFLFILSSIHQSTINQEPLKNPTTNVALFIYLFICSSQSLNPGNTETEIHPERRQHEYQSSTSIFYKCF